MALTWGDLTGAIQKVASGQSAGDILSTIAQNNLAANANQNIFPRPQDPAAVPGTPAYGGIPPIVYGSTAGVKNYHWMFAALGLGALFIAMKGRK